jgi:protein gp37
MATTTIEWTDATWNPSTGCTKISAGCKFCYAEIMHKRLQAMHLPKYDAPFSAFREHENELKRPYSWKKGKTVFVNSMSDLFHEDATLDFVKRVFVTMNENPQHRFQVLTKRAERLAEFAPFLTWSDNIWMGVSVESKAFLKRVDFLRQVPAKVRFLSCEPLLRPLGAMNLEGIHWVIVGGESGHTPRPMEKEWVEDIQAQCVEQGAAFFFKQWGGTNKKASGRLLNGRTYDEMP